MINKLSFSSSLNLRFEDEESYIVTSVSWTGANKARHPPLSAAADPWDILHWHYCSRRKEPYERSWGWSSGCVVPWLPISTSTNQVGIQSKPGCFSYAACGRSYWAKFLCVWSSRAVLIKSNNGSTDCRNLSSVQLASHKPSMWQAQAWKDKD